ncbi:hypothetical protein KM043_015196 [Ampulex compressa]|nr:hypothetical protein KM043_015196 [Ampulex compressa]
MMLHKVNCKLCRLCGKEKQQGTDVFKDKVKGAVLISIINKYFSKEVINILTTDAFSKYVCIDCEQKICIFDEFCLMVANVQKQLAAPSLEIDFAEDMLCHLKENDTVAKSSENKQKTRRCICPVCTKTFRCQAHLDRHKRIHTGQRPFVCNICRMSFNQQEILMKHVGRHEGKRQFQCANCHQSFRYKVSLQSHMINFHMDMEQSIVNHRNMPIESSSFACSECEIRAQPQHSNQTVDRDMTAPLNNFHAVYISESEIQKTINETINSTDPSTSYLTKMYENPLYIDDEIETMLDHDLVQLEQNKYSTHTQEKVSLCLKQPETPELLHSLLYDD